MVVYADTGGHFRRDRGGMRAEEDVLSIGKKK
jgi:hypothetical protein